MEFGIFNLMGSREADKPTAAVFGEVAEQTKLADELGYTIAWFAEHHFSNYCLCASPLMMVAHCAGTTKNIRLGTAVVVLPLPAAPHTRVGRPVGSPPPVISSRPTTPVGDLGRAGLLRPLVFEGKFCSRVVGK